MHTPTPWMVSHADVAGPAQQLVWIDAEVAPSEGIADLYHRTKDGEFVVKRDAEANAAFIVRAVNAHDDLVAALRQIIEAEDSYREYVGDLKIDDPLADAVKAAKTLLAKLTPQKEHA